MTCWNHDNHSSYLIKSHFFIEKGLICINLFWRTTFCVFHEDVTLKKSLIMSDLPPKYQTCRICIYQSIPSVPCFSVKSCSRCWRVSGVGAGLCRPSWRVSSRTWAGWRSGLQGWRRNELIFRQPERSEGRRGTDRRAHLGHREGLHQ